MEWKWNHRAGNSCRSDCGRWVITVLHPGAFELWDVQEKQVIAVFPTIAEAQARAKGLTAK